jgi:hypothetical protein
VDRHETGPAAGNQPIVWDMVRALFVAGQLFVLLFVTAALLGAISQATAPPSSVPDTVMPALGFDDVALLAVATAIAIAGAVGSVRLWLRGSWKVVTAAVGTALAMLLIAAAFVVLNLVLR